MKSLRRPLLSALSALGLVAATHAATTLDNLATAYAGETSAANRYARFAQQADAEGYPQVAVLFRAAAKSEEIHHKRHRAAITKLGGSPADAPLQPIS